jgi:hypothetical protein
MSPLPVTPALRKKVLKVLFTSLLLDLVRRPHVADVIDPPYLPIDTLAYVWCAP